MKTICPYCNCEVNESLVEADDGCCPECGALLCAPDGMLNDEFEEDRGVFDEDGIQNEDDEGDDYRDDDEFGEAVFGDDEDDLDDDENDEDFDFDEKGQRN